ncbi:MAG: L-seryl-tRNA(Sec) selenium transferase, partial [Firmicutes bacterium]|nr:L-seryl-tRNA(Sec) selenium transferase [Bacillota bacterium]
SVRASLRAGADVVCFSGDKLLGGPQAGIVLGKKAVVENLRKHPVARAVRLDKMTLAALEATLRLYLDPDQAQKAIPTLRYLARTAAETESLARALQTAIERRLTNGFVVDVEESSARAGGGSLPLVELPSHAVRIRAGEATAAELEAMLRKAPMPVIGRVAQDAVLLDVLALEEADVDLV